MSTYSRSLTGKKIWVTGGAGYLGSAITLALDAEGAETLCIDLPGKAAALIESAGLKHTKAIDQNIFEVDKLEAFVEKTVAEHGIPDGVVNMPAASSSGKTLQELSLADFQRPYLTAVSADFVLVRAMAERMKTNGGGSLVMFSSMYGIISPDPSIYHAPMAVNPIDYGASKAAILQMARYFAVHYGPDKVRVNCITPGPFPNPNIQRDYPDFIERLNAKVPMKRVGTNHEIAGPTLFLLSDSASFVTGHSLDVDGGWMAW